MKSVGNIETWNPNHMYKSSSWGKGTNAKLGQKHYKSLDHVFVLFYLNFPNK